MVWKRVAVTVLSVMAVITSTESTQSQGIKYRELKTSSETNLYQPRIEYQNYHFRECGGRLQNFESLHERQVDESRGGAEVGQHGIPQLSAQARHLCRGYLINQVAMDLRTKCDLIEKQPAAILSKNLLKTKIPLIL